MINIYGEILTDLKATLSTVKVVGAYPKGTVDLPIVVFVETTNDTIDSAVDTAGEFASRLAFTIDIFSDSEEKIAEVNNIRTQIDAVLGGKYRMRRQNIGAIENYSDTNIYRYVVRYTGSVDKNMKLYGR